MAMRWCSLPSVLVGNGHGTLSCSTEKAPSEDERCCPKWDSDALFSTIWLLLMPCNTFHPSWPVFQTHRMHCERPFSKAEIVKINLTDSCRGFPSPTAFVKILSHLCDVTSGRLLAPPSHLVQLYRISISRSGYVKLCGLMIGSAYARDGPNSR